MNVDAITLASVADEWRVLLTGARIDTIIGPTGYAIALQCYAPGALGGQGGPGGSNRWLYLSAHPQLARVHLTARQEVMTLIEALKLPLDDRGQRRAAARAEWFSAHEKPLEIPDILEA